jgi:hypothetical protein
VELVECIRPVNIYGIITLHPEGKNPLGRTMRIRDQNSKKNLENEESATGLHPDLDGSTPCSLILPYHLDRVLSSSIFTSGSPTKILYEFVFPAMVYAVLLSSSSI